MDCGNIQIQKYLQRQPQADLTSGQVLQAWQQHSQWIPALAWPIVRINAEQADPARTPRCIVWPYIEIQATLAHIMRRLFDRIIEQRCQVMDVGLALRVWPQVAHACG